ncbi:hypothetical protein RCL1_003876 [Eukaryota sp. TZLM3-RCL]
MSVSISIPKGDERAAQNKHIMGLLNNSLRNLQPKLPQFISSLKLTHFNLGTAINLNFKPVHVEGTYIPGTIPILDRLADGIFLVEYSGDVECSLVCQVNFSAWVPSMKTESSKRAFTALKSPFHTHQLPHSGDLSLTLKSLSVNGLFEIINKDKSGPWLQITRISNLEIEEIHSNNSLINKLKDTIMLKLKEKLTGMKIKIPKMPQGK